MRDIATVAAACAVIAGAVEVVITAYKQFVLHQIIFQSYDFAWMTPVSFLILVVPVALAVHGLLKLVGQPPALATALGLLTAVLVCSMLIPYGSLAWWASGSLAVGVGVQVSRLAARGLRERWLPVLRRVAAGLAVIMAVTGIGIRGARGWAARQATSALLTPAADGPNVLLIVLDTVRASNMGIYGSQNPTTPELQGWAEESTIFENAMATAPWTLPSHSSLLTGQSAGSVGADWLTPLSKEPRTLAEALRDRGYATGGFVANLRYTSYESGLTRGFLHYDDYRVSWPLVLFHSTLGRIDVKSRLPQARSVRSAWTALRNSSLKEGNVSRHVFRPADQVSAAFLDWQQGVTNRPFFAFLNFYDAHGPYRPPEDFAQRFSGDLSSDLGRYDAAIAWLDYVVSQTMKSLRERGVLDRTIVIVTSDHGEQFGEHGLRDHGNSLYLPVLKVPLLIRYPSSVPQGLRVGGVVSLKDVAATILDLAGANGDRTIPGTSLANAWTQPGQGVYGDVIAELGKGINEAPPSRNSEGNMVARFDKRFHYIRDGAGSEELYDVIADPQELNNLVANPALRADLIRLRTGLPGR